MRADPWWWLFVVLLVLWLVHKGFENSTDPRMLSEAGVGACHMSPEVDMVEALLGLLAVQMEMLLPFGSEHMSAQIDRSHVVLAPSACCHKPPDQQLGHGLEQPAATVAAVADSSPQPAAVAALRARETW